MFHCWPILFRSFSNTFRRLQVSVSQVVKSVSLLVLGRPSGIESAPLDWFGLLVTCWQDTR
jgi:hypothetical protein